jgi:hypothetical protein
MKNPARHRCNNSLADYSIFVGDYISEDHADNSNADRYNQSESFIICPTLGKNMKEISTQRIVAGMN